MTAEREIVEVEQRDREEAWPFRPSCYKDSTTTRHNWRDGVYDKIPVIQSFARHRINVLAAAIDEGREAVVKWLRDDAGKTRDDLRRLHAGRKLTPSQTAQWEDLISLKLGISNAIERGEHRNRETRRG